MTTTFRLAPYCLECLPGLHAPLYAALATDSFRDAGIEVEARPTAPREQRLERLRRGSVDLALMDVASLVDSHAADPAFGARCVFMLTQRLPMAVHVIDHPANTTEQTGKDLRHARYGGAADSSFVAEHRALLRRLGQDDPSLRVDMPYGRLFDALADGHIDVAPDYAGTETRFRRAAAPTSTRTVPYRDCGVTAYGIGFVASAAGLRRHPTRMATVCSILARAYRRMQQEPEGVLDDAARLIPQLDRDYALAEWHDEEAGVVFGYAAATSGIGVQDTATWAATTTWRQEVTGTSARPSADSLFERP